MAEYAVNSVANAITGELTSRVFSGLAQRYGKDAATSEKLQRLEILLIKINSAIEVLEKCTMESSSLLQWRDKLKEAALEGDEVLASLPHRPKDAQAQASSNTNNGNQQQGEAVPSSAAAPSADVGPLSFTRNSVNNMVQGGICNAGKMLFSSGGDDMERLNKTLGRLEKLDIGEFIRLLHLDALPNVGPNSYSTAPPTKVHGRTEKMEETRDTKRMKNSDTCNSPSLERSLFNFPARLQLIKMSHLFSDPKRSDKVKPRPRFCYLSESALYLKQQLVSSRQGRLNAALTEIWEAVELADSRNLKDLEWLAYWAGTLREAKEQGRDVLNTTVIAKGNQEPIVGPEQEDELSSFVHRLEGLVRDVEYFRKLVDLCPAS